MKANRKLAVLADLFAVFVLGAFFSGHSSTDEISLYLDGNWSDDPDSLYDNVFAPIPNLADTAIIQHDVIIRLRSKHDVEIGDIVYVLILDITAYEQLNMPNACQARNLKGLTNIRAPCAHVTDEDSNSIPIAIEGNTEWSGGTFAGFF